MEAKAQSFAQIVSEPKYIVVPFFQRGYVWGKENWEDLLDELSASESNHFLGSVIFKHSHNNMGENFWSVVDGQQRLTTLSILFSVCCKLLIDLSANEYERKFYESRKEQLLFVVTPSGLKIKLKHSRADREAYAEAITLETEEPCHSGDGENGIVSCRQFFFKELTNKPGKARKIFDLLNSLDAKILVNIQLEDNDNEQAIFDTINSAGVRLTAADTIKNTLFQKMMEATDQHSEVEHLHDEYWEKVFYGEDKTYWLKLNSQGRIKRITLEMLLHCVAVIEGFYDPNKHSVGELADCYKEYVKNKSLLQLSDFVKTIVKYAKTYRRFFWNEDESEDGHKYKYKNICDRTLHILRFCDTSTFDPLILKLVTENPIGEAGAISDVLRTTLDGIATYVLRHVVCHASTKNFNKECALIISGERTIESYILEKVGSTDAKSRIADDDVRRGLCNVKNNRIARGVLFWLELKRRSQLPYDVQEMSDVNMELEHLMPQKWDEFWPITCPPVVDPESGSKVDDSVAAESGRRNAVYEIGNMALLNKKLNIIIRNHSMREKVLGNGPQCPGIAQLAEMKYTLDVVHKVEGNDYLWNEKTIRDRTNELTAEFLSVWGVVDIPQTVSPQCTHAPVAHSSEMAMSQGNESINNELHESQAASTSSPVQVPGTELKIGKIAKMVFPVLFAEDRITDNDVNFLLSDAARIQFKTQGNKVLKETSGNVEDDARDAKGVKRFYTNILLEHGGKHYLLTSQWFANGKSPLLAWFAEHGIGEERVAELCG